MRKSQRRKKEPGDLGVKGGRHPGKSPSSAPSPFQEKEKLGKKTEEMLKGAG